jgi:hypothetical protein
MTQQNAEPDPSHNIVSSVFEDFLAALSSKAIVEEKIIEQLRSALLDKQDLSAEAIRRALFLEESPQ